MAALTPKPGDLTELLAPSAVIATSSDVLLPAPASALNFFISFTGSLTAWSADIETSLDGVTWYAVATKTSTKPMAVIQMTFPAGRARVKVTSIGDGSVGVKVHYT